jgi:hypothetical protein
LSVEIPPVTNGSATAFAGGSTAITGWTVVGFDVGIISGTFTQSGITFQAQSGNQSADLTGNSNSNTNGLRQLLTTVPGQMYDLEFYVGSARGGGIFFPATVDLSIDGGTRTSYFNPTGPSNMLKLEVIQRAVYCHGRHDQFDVLQRKCSKQQFCRAR